jgi:NAD(P)-dependent dehydrogenase (short-subunit alcohol dehydrogenase family)
MKVSEQVVMVTGASSGLGAATVRRFLEAGAKVIGVDLRPSVPGIAGNRVESYLHQCGDVTDESVVQAMVDQSIARFGKLSVLVCCAGILHGERVWGRNGPASLEAFRRVVDVNLVGTFNVVRLAIPAMARRMDRDHQEDRGLVVLTSSIAASDGQIGQAAYAASKGAIASMVLPMARELAKHQIRVIAVAPGVFDTPMMQAASEKVRQPLLEQTVFPKRFGQPEEFASLVEHAVANPMLNGCVLRLDAGLRM